MAQAARVKTDLNTLRLHAASKGRSWRTRTRFQDVRLPAGCACLVPCTFNSHVQPRVCTYAYAICNATSLIIAGPGVLAVANGEICPSICMRAQIITKEFPGLAACVRIHNERSAGGQPQHRQHGIVPTRWTPRGIVSLIGMRKSLTLGTYIDDPEMVPSHMGTDPLVTSDAEQATNETRNAVLLGGRAKAQLDISSRVGSRSFSLSDISELLARRFQMSPNRQPPVSPIGCSSPENHHVPCYFSVKIGDRDDLFPAKRGMHFHGLRVAECSLQPRAPKAMRAGIPLTKHR